MDALLEVLREEGLRAHTYQNLGASELARILKGGGVALVRVDGDHCAVAHKATKEHIYVADPSFLRMLGTRLTWGEFEKRWDRSGLIAAR